jgi:Tfp pilus assembly protein PilP
MRALFAVLVALTLSACQTTSGGCPPLVTYSAETQRLAAKELRALPKDSQVAKLVVDYGKMRAACRIGDGS